MGLDDKKDSADSQDNDSATDKKDATSKDAKSKDPGDPSQMMKGKNSETGEAPDGLPKWIADLMKDAAGKDSKKSAQKGAGKGKGASEDEEKDMDKKPSPGGMGGP